jgi:hypothetical protein
VISAFSIGKTKQKRGGAFWRRVLNAPPRLNIKIFALPSSLWLLPWSLLDPPCQIYGGLLD